MLLFAQYVNWRIRIQRKILPLVSVALVGLTATPNFPLGRPRIHRRKAPPPLAQILSSMNERAKHLKTVSANLEYTKVTVVVNDKSTEYGRMFFKKGKSTEILINFQKPDPKVIAFRKNKAEIYLPKSNQIQIYDLQKQSGLIEQFLLLGFGEETGDLRKAYSVKLTGEEELNGDTTAVLELTPLAPNVVAQLAKVQLWVSEDSWTPIQQKFFEAGGDYLLTRYTDVQIGRVLTPSDFEIKAPDDVKRVKMN